jgi:hypothetical protein
MPGPGRNSLTEHLMGQEEDWGCLLCQLRVLALRAWLSVRVPVIPALRPHGLAHSWRSELGHPDLLVAYRDASWSSRSLSRAVISQRR